MKLKLLVLSLLSAGLFPLALPNELLLEGSAILGLFCLSFYFWAIYEAPSFKFAAVLGVIFGAVTTVLAQLWLKNYNEFAIYTLGGTTLGYLGYNALLAVLIHGLGKIKPSQRPIVTAMLFAVYEYLKSSGFLAFPYGLIAYPAHTILPFIQFVDITGLWGLSFLCAYFSSLLAEAFHLRFHFSPATLAFRLHRRAVRLRDKGLFALALTAIAFSYGALRLGVGFTHDNSLLVMLVQQNVDSWRDDQAVAGIRTARDLTQRGLKESEKKFKRPPDLVVWSETALRYVVDTGKKFPFDSDSFYGQYFPGLFNEFNTATLTGAPIVTSLPRRYYNAAILVTKDGRVTQTYGKQHPVPFVESIPFMEIDFVRDFFENKLGLSNFWLMGKEASVFTLPLAGGKTARFGAPICFEDVFPDICRALTNRGADLLINLTNDSWSKMKSALTQHTAAARFRAIETRKPLLRSTNAGLTCVIDPTGAIVDQGIDGEIFDQDDRGMIDPAGAVKVTGGLPLFKAGYLLAEVPLAGAGVTTLYAWAGDYMPYAFALFLLGLLAINAYGEGGRRLIAKLRGARKTNAPASGQNTSSST